MSQLQKSNSNFNKSSIIAELVLSPRSPKLVSISEPLKEALTILQDYPGIDIEIHSMGTNLSCASLDILFDAVKLVHNFLINKGFPRVVTNLRIDERSDKPIRSFKDKVKAVK